MYTHTHTRTHTKRRGSTRRASSASFACRRRSASRALVGALPPLRTGAAGGVRASFDGGSDGGPGGRGRRMTPADAGDGAVAVTFAFPLPAERPAEAIGVAAVADAFDALDKNIINGNWCGKPHVKFVRHLPHMTGHQ